MADITTELNGQPVTLIDNGDGTYRIDLGTSDARKFIRLGELEELRGDRDQQKALITLYSDSRDHHTAEKDRYAALRLTAVAERDAINLRIDELVAWLESVGDIGP